LPNDLHVVENLHLSWNVTHTAAAVGDALTPKPANLQIDRIEIYCGTGSNITAQIRGSDAHLTYLASESDESYRLSAAPYGLHQIDRGQVEASFPAAAAIGDVTTKVYRIQIKSIFDNSRLFLPPLGEVRCRVYWEEQMHDARVGAGAIALTQTQIEVDAIELTASDYNRLFKQSMSSSGISHRFVNYQHSIHPYAVANGQSITQVLSSHSASYVIGMLVYFRSQNLAAQSVYYPITNLSLTDDKNAKLSETVTHEQLITKVFPTAGFAGDGPRTIPAYWLPFCVSLQAALTQGVVSGGLAFSSRDRLQFTSGAALAAVNAGAINLEAVTLSFSTLKISNGKCQVFHS
jgi:hypothetical protein